MKVIQRKVEAVVGGKLLKMGGEILLKKSQLIPKQIKLQDGLIVHYYERNAVADGKADDDDDDAPTLLLLHGIADEAKNMAGVVVGLQKELPHWRMIVPDLIGHGKDMDRAKKEGSSTFVYPSPQRLLESVIDFVQALQLKNLTVLGISLGGGLAYFLQEQQPQLIHKTILINPAIESVVDTQFIDDFNEGRKNHFCFENRSDVKILFRDLSCPHRKKKNPVPKFLLEAIWQDRLKHEPTHDHFRKLFSRLLEERGKDPEWVGCEKDIAPNAPRLVIWPENDFIANHEKGKAFFANSPQTTFHSVPDCGHLFHSDGKNIFEHILPQIIEYLKQENEEQR